ncbi:MAG TPA: glycosyltransferase [Solirubrobacterales bacterium]
MKVVFLNPSLAQGQRSARFLRGVAAELAERGHGVDVSEPAAGGDAALPTIGLDDADLVVVHDSSPPSLVARVGEHHRRHDGYRLLFHAVDRPAPTAAWEADSLDLSGYDGILAGDEAIHNSYLEAGWQERAWTWREAADTRIFHPLPEIEPEADLVSFANWADAEQSEALRDLLLRPARQLRLRGAVHGPPPPWSTRLRLRLAGLHPCPAAADREIPERLARHRLTVQAPSRSTPISCFEALACGIPLITAPGGDADGLFRPERDYLVARDCAEMREAVQAVLELPEFAAQLSQSGLESIRAGHTCAHRAHELVEIDGKLSGRAPLEVAG